MSSQTHSAPAGAQPTANSARDVPGQFPEPIVFMPNLDHRQTFIILHGRGSTASKFGQPLLDTAATTGEKLQEAFPHAKIIFPTATRNRAVIYKKSLTHQWFDHWHFTEPNKRQDLMSPGLHKSCNYIQEMLQREIDIVGAKNVVLWGLSQGCATSLVTTLAWDGEPFAATIGMCGYLPYANHIEDIAKSKNSGSNNNEEDDDPFSHSDNEDDDDPFSHSDDEDNGDDMFEKDSSSSTADKPSQAISFLREEIEMDEKKGMVFQQIPIFLGHGTEDEKVPLELGQEVKRCLDMVGGDVEYVEYEGLGHWYSAEMFEDIFRFLREKLSV